MKRSEFYDSPVCRKASSPGPEGLKENQNTPRPSEHPPVMGEKMSKRLGGIKRLQIQNLSCDFPEYERILDHPMTSTIPSCTTPARPASFGEVPAGTPQIHPTVIERARAAIGDG